MTQISIINRQIKLKFNKPVNKIKHGIHTTERPHKVHECDENDEFGKNEKFDEISWSLSTKLYE